MLIKWIQRLPIRFSQKLLRPKAMAPPLIHRGDGNMAHYLEGLIGEHRIMIFSKSYCPYCSQVKQFFDGINEKYTALELDQMEDGGGDVVQGLLNAKTGQNTVPNVFVNGSHVGGCDATLAAHANRTLYEMLRGTEFEYDLAVIGGGSGGLAAGKEAARLGRKVIVLDFVKPTPKNVTWGLGGTCVNVGCIPKKLMHKAALMGEEFKDAPFFGWEFELARHNWETMVTEIQDYIKSLNFGYRTQLQQKGIAYSNAYAKFVGPHKLKAENKQGKVTEITAHHFIVAVGGRPSYPNIPGAKEFGITSDDLFSLKSNPGKTLLVGASYIALECAGFLAGLGVDCTVMVRSILLRGFDQQMAEMIGKHMEMHNVKFIRECVPTKVEKVSEDDAPVVLKVTAQDKTGKEFVEEYNTVIFAVGRTASTGSLGLKELGVELNMSNGKVIANEEEQSSVEHIYAIGDVLDDKLELTPVAIQAGKLLAQRLFSNKKMLMDYTNVPTTVFTPLEYACVGLSEEQATSKFGKENIEVYHTHFQPLEFELSKRDQSLSYGKMICLKTEFERVVGLHLLGPNAGEIMQGYAIGLKLGATKSDFSSLVGIHPTCAEWFTVMDTSKASGISVEKASC